MFEELNKHREEVANNIAKGFETDFEKAHQVGDIHPNHPDLVWTEYKPGKFDWRGIKKKVEQSHFVGLTEQEKTEMKFLESAANRGYRLRQKDADRLRRLQRKEREATQQQTATQSQKTTPKSSVVEDFLKIKTNEISTLQKKAVDKGFSQMSGEIKINNKNTKIVVVVRENDNFFERKPNTYSIKIGTDEEYPHIQTISENRNITVDQINDAIKKWVKEKEK